MSIRNIRNKEDEVLRKKSRDVTSFDEKLFVLLDDMLETMEKNDGVGIAAPQVGILRNVIIVKYQDKVYEFINPVILEQSGEEQALEGCLSCPGQWGLVTRPNKITFKYQDRSGKEFKKSVEGFFSRIILHEVDHLHGRLFIDIVDRFLTDEEINNY